MPLSADDQGRIDDALKHWRQGDVTLDAGLEFALLADLTKALGPAAQKAMEEMLARDEPIPGEVEAVFEEVPGLVVLSQTCDIVRPCSGRPFIEVAPLIRVDQDTLEHVRRMKMPALAYVPALAQDCLVADLDRTMTVEKSIISRWNRIPGWQTDAEIRDFAFALSRKRSRFAFPDDFAQAATKLQARLIAKHDRDSPEGKHLSLLSEIRVRATPSWDEEQVGLEWWFIKDGEPDGQKPEWAAWKEKWMALFDQSGRFRVESAVVARLEDITARDYRESDHLDLDRLSLQK